jgi:hypothetical protein
MMTGPEMPPSPDTEVDRPSGADERSQLEEQEEHGKDISTEDLRMALRHYRSFFDRLLSI